MATFNPQVNYDRVPETLNYSKGYKTGAGVLGEALNRTASVLDEKIKATDRAFAQLATDETRVAVENTDARLFNVGQQEPSVDPLDLEVRSQVRNLESKKKAMEVGSISPEHYYATIQAKVKEIRTRYSGYNEQVDEELRRLGIDPNYQRKQILAAGERAANAAAERQTEADRHNQQLVDYALKNTMLSPEEQGILVQEGSWRDPKVMLMAKTRIAQQTALKSRLEFNRMEAEMIEGNDKLKARKAAEGYSTELQTNLASVVARSVDYKQLQTSLETLNKKVAAGESPSTEEISTLTGRINLIKGEMQKIKLATKANYAGLSPLISDEMKKADELFDSTIDGIADALTNQKTGLLSYHTNRLNLMLTGKKLSITENSEAMTTLSAYKELFGENITNTIASRNLEQARDAADADFRNAGMMDLGTGKLKSVRQVLAKGDKPEDFDGNSTKQLLDHMISVLEDPSTLPTGRKAYLNGFYNEDNKGLWDLMFTGNNLNEDEKQSYLRRLTNPKIIQSIKETGDINIMNNFSDTVAYLTAKSNTMTANDLMAIRATSTSTDIKWDAKQSRFTLIPRTDPTVNPTYRFLNKIGSKIGELTGSEQQVVNRINSSIIAVRDTADMLGLDKQEAVGTFLRSLGIDVNAPKQGGVLERIDKRSNEFIKEQKEKNLGGGSGTDRLGGGEGEDRLQSQGLYDFSLVGDVKDEAARLAEGELSGRTPSTRDKVMEALTTVGLNPEQASKIADAAEFAIGPANTPQDAALAALTVIPGGRVAGAAKTAGRASLSVLEGGVAKVEKLLKALPDMSPSDLAKAEKELAAEMKTVDFNDFAAMEDIQTRGGFIAAERANRLEKAKGETSSFIDELNKGIVESQGTGAMSAERWKANAAQLEAQAKSNVVSLDNVRAAREAMKVADDHDAEVVKFIETANKQASKQDTKIARIVNKLDKNIERFMNLAEDSVNRYGDSETGSVISTLVDRVTKYSKAMEMQEKNLARINEHGMVKGLRKIHEDLEVTKSELAELIEGGWELLEDLTRIKRVK